MSKANKEISIIENLRDTKHNKKANTVFLKLYAKLNKPKNPFDEVRSYTPPSMREIKPGENINDTN